MAKEKTLREKILALKWFNNPNEVIPILLELLGQSGGGIQAIEAGLNVTITGEGTEEVPYIINSSGGGEGSGIQSIQAGTNIEIDDSDPSNPIINVTGGLNGFIPLSGTEVGSPVTGNIELDGGDISLTNKGQNFYVGATPDINIPSSNNSLTIYQVSGETVDRTEQLKNTEGAFQVTTTLDQATGKASVTIGTAANTDFNGYEYAIDYSTNYTNRSLVDKEYVDSVASTQDLQSVTDVGNTTNNSLTISNTGQKGGFTLIDSEQEFKIAELGRTSNAEEGGFLTLGTTKTMSRFQLRSDNLIQDYDILLPTGDILPEESLVLPISINGKFADENGNINIEGLYGNVTVNPSETNPIIIPHGLGTTPSYINVLLSDSTTIELREHDIAVDDTNITITFSNTPVGITSLTIWWEVKI